MNDRTRNALVTLHADIIAAENDLTTHAVRYRDEEDESHGAHLARHELDRALLPRLHNLALAVENAAIILDENDSPDMATRLRETAIEAERMEERPFPTDERGYADHELVYAAPLGALCACVDEILVDEVEQ